MIEIKKWANLTHDQVGLKFVMKTNVSNFFGEIWDNHVRTPITNIAHYVPPT